MTERDVFFLVMIAITATALVVWVVQAYRSRKRRGDGRGDHSNGPWWEGPWSDDNRKP